MQCPRAVFFDLDDTLAESFHPPVPEMLERLRRLLEHVPVAIITGASFQRMHEQFLTSFETHPNISQLYIFPTSSAQAYIYAAGIWELLYDLAITEADREHIKKGIADAVSRIDALKDVPHFGEQIIDKGSQIAYTPVGVEAPKELKDSWDLDGSKRLTLLSLLKDKLPEFEVLMGGVTTIDITRKNVNKAYGVRWLSERLSIPIGEMFYVGDAFSETGNDTVVIPTGVEWRAVSGPAETKRILDELIAACSA
ncbi:hypothetical protein A2763_04450 [Candidatus Kaiserbacteria bacterium RIFCSPHIGHO2_01_FULL_54_36]|uniref:phosphomannomutase n=1 Tax=Candidatus Kaiserbacteria bacterium RIFCSPHIGHO2_01_FULL_54_36 TaxID=1798482 RepID=A0A1F6CN76_9BACT|nr:MAG: hypothetical protein A2763_04450 [Candidatus Kaiserbacteria bacterium RIFCSPHIGHO2_01_FULL_54_36]OGG75875.1 MAG: hypothetical protein A3A41_01485 [Candidatus Kaiserbacteria bacterium RIFCSPLOWO2_01_FULL_54_22]